MKNYWIQDTVNVLKFGTPVCHMAYACNADPDQTAPEGSSLIRVYTVRLSTKYFVEEMHKKQSLAKKLWHKVFETLGHLQYVRIQKDPDWTVQMHRLLIWPLSVCRCPRDAFLLDELKCKCV